MPYYAHYINPLYQYGRIEFTLCIYLDDTTEVLRRDLSFSGDALEMHLIEAAQQVFAEYALTIEDPEATLQDVLIDYPGEDSHG